MMMPVPTEVKQHGNVEIETHQQLGRTATGRVHGGRYRQTHLDVHHLAAKLGRRHHQKGDEPDRQSHHDLGQDAQHETTGLGGERVLGNGQGRMGQDSHSPGQTDLHLGLDMFTRQNRRLLEDEGNAHKSQQADSERFVKFIFHGSLSAPVP